jgi:hypothetical protein
VSAAFLVDLYQFVAAASDFDVYVPATEISTGNGMIISLGRTNRHSPAKIWGRDHLIDMTSGCA